MFGHQSSDDINNAANGMPSDAVAPPHEPETIAPTASSVPPLSDHAANDFVMTDLPAPAPAPAPAPEPTPIPAPPAPSVPTVVPAPSPVDSVPAPGPAVAGDLLDLKQAALQELSPLVGHLEQTPEEKFRTTMMMIQASDDQTLLRAALDAAKEIKDEKARAQALLDVVNEINYFTQQHDNAA